ncbi:cation diffusion facilitator family transporter [Sedimentibacter acidaminivorans]|uniref:Cation diffusion facilitator family transporter n=1 Tax=Sedimentibacter acidaminivorans TaxID=913099 RepID=A0ABS4GDM1_9FIRM|nr:cation diffusion facilitator family transporter [Sedimentibacter acidaminivorans]MBP1925788.1 cation diffusion facilitator family transporter [Sedimentibacter acidaminivorans]
MTNFIIKKFIKDYENTKDSSVREAYGKLGSIIGIISNVFLCVSKISVGLIFKSISITADGVNNLSDAGSSVITLIGFKMAGKPADKKHPFGHERIEYISGMIVAFVILLLGLELVKSSFDKIINPEPINFSYIMIFVLILSIVVKLWLSYFNGKIADKISSTTMKATSMDSRNDVIATSVVLVSIIVSKITGYQIDGYMGMIVALFIMFSGINILKDLMNPLLGELPDPEFVESIENKIIEYEGILNIHDLVVHNYGPSKYFATVHAEVDAKQDILICHDLIDNIERDFARDLDINLVIHLDPVVTDDKEINKLREQLIVIIKSIDERLSMHDFRIVKGKTHTNLIFDVVIPVDFKIPPKELINQIERSINEENNADEIYYLVVTIDKNYVSTCLNKPNMK